MAPGNTVPVGRQLVEDALYLFCQAWDVDARGRPQNVEVNREVVVHHTVTHTDDLPPRHLPIPAGELRRQPERCLADHLYEMGEHDLHILVGVVPLPAAPHPGRDLLRRVQDVRQPLPRPAAQTAVQTGTASASTRSRIRSFSPPSVATCVNTPSRSSTASAKAAMSKYP